MSDFYTPRAPKFLRTDASAAAQYYQTKRNTVARGRSVDDKSAKAWGSIVFASNDAQTITLGGTVVTFGTDFDLGADLAATLAALLVFLNASADANISKATYAIQGTALAIRDKLPGVATFTLAASAGTVSHATLQLPKISARAPL